MKTLALALILVLAPVASVAHAQLEGDAFESTHAPHPVSSVQDTETRAQRDHRLAWFRDARFGMFIHWGLYSVPAGEWKGKRTDSIGEWIMNDLSIPVADYKGLAAQFNPTGFSAHDIVALAKSAGMKYIIITAKHHDGFAMFDSKASAFNIVAATPFHRDPLRELAEECRAQGIQLGFYYSQDQDWTAPGGSAIMRDHHDPVTHHWDKAQDGDFGTYFHTKALPQVRELLDNYKDFPVVVWFDTPTHNMTPALAAEMVTLLNQHPNLIWNNRLGGGYDGDTETPEQYVPPTGFPGRDWEACMTMNDTWGFKSFDTNFKSSQDLLRNLIDIASKGGNYLLNIGPDSHGIVPAPEVDRLQDMGRWLRANGEAIYGAGPSLFTMVHGSFASAPGSKPGDPKPKRTFNPVWDWRSTTAPDKLYIAIFAWPKGRFHLDALPRTVTDAYLLADPAHKPLKFRQTGASLDIELPAQPLDPVATVLVLKTTG